MIKVIPIHDIDNVTQEPPIERLLEIEVRHVHVENEICTFEVSFEHETQGEN